MDEEIAYTKELLQVLDEGIESCGNQKIQKISKKMKELLENEQIKEIRSKDDKDARFGHKTPSSTFYGYKNHLAMTEERLIAGISVTNGGVPHRIEEKNGELKEAHGLRRADSRGLFAMHLQMFFTAFAANEKRIVRLEELAMG